MIGRCPACGAQRESVGITVNLDDNTVTTTLGTVKLFPAEAEMASVLAKRSPEFVRKDVLFVALYGAMGTERGDNIITVYACKMRKKLRIIGIDVQVIGGGGYRMVMAP